MKKKSLQLKEKRGALVDELKGINAAVKNSEDGNLTDKQLKRVGEIQAETAKLDDQIKAALYLEKETRKLDQAKLDADKKEQEKRQRLLGGNPTGDGEKREVSKLRRQFRFVKVIASQLPGAPTLTGVEKEVIQEGQKEARAKGINPEGFAIPSFFVGEARHIGIAEKRADLNVGAAATAGNLVDTSIMEVIEYLYPETALVGAGARILTGLSGNVDLVRKNGVGAATWEGENDEAAQTNPTFENLPMRPKRLAAFEIYGKQLVLQTDAISVENMVREDLSLAIGQGLESAAINGASGGDNPTGILNIAGIGSVAIGANGGVPTWDSIVDLETALGNANALRGTLGYLTTPGMIGKLKKTKIDAGSGDLVVQMNQSGAMSMNGYPIHRSTLVPSNLTKGTTTTPSLHAILFGNFRELYMAQWGGLDIVVDPYTLATKAQVKVTVNSWWDIALRHAQSFAAIKDGSLT